MSKIKLLDKVLDSLRNWIANHHKITIKIQDNILQRDSANKIEEKIISIGLSSFLVYIGTAIAGLFGIATGGFLISIVLFPAGWMISKLINKKIFGDERKIDNITDEERTILKTLQSIDERYKTMGLQIRFKKIAVNFTNFADHRAQLKSAVDSLSKYDASKLALKYRYRHSLIAKKYEKLANQFNTIYAHKKGDGYA